MPDEKQKPKPPANESEQYKNFFELTKHLTTLSTGLIVFLATIATGFIGDLTPNLTYLWLTFISLISSVGFCVITMFSIANIQFSGKKGWLGIGNIFVGVWLSIISFLLGLMLVVLSVLSAL